MTPASTHPPGDEGAFRAVDGISITANASRDDGGIALRRMGNDLLMLWALCGKPACRRAQACRGNPSICARRYGRLAPQAAREGMLMLMYAMTNDVDEEAVRAHASPEIAAFDAWVIQVEEAVYGPAPTVARETGARP